jgi:EAL domain-containing protein (putative c-di-GMP-specific phosphodiesterase class I)
MYEAKRLGRNRYVWFNIEMQDRLLERTRLEAEIRVGIELGQFVPYFQPQFELSSASIKGFEVLARWEHPVRGTIMPDEFIPVAEESGLISELSNEVMRTALEYARDWPSSLTIAANLSPVQFKDPLLADRILALLREVNFPPERLELELTESAILNDAALALQTVTRLRDAGVRISLDDFGTGYASLSQLRELPFDRIKIDKSFIVTLLEDKQSGAIVEAIAALGRGLSLPITAEGVETEGVQDQLIALGCTDAQGWFFGKPVPHDEAAKAHLVAAYGEALSAEEANREVAEARPNADRRSYARRGQ